MGLRDNLFLASAFWLISLQIELVKHGRCEHFRLIFAATGLY